AGHPVDVVPFRLGRCGILAASKGAETTHAPLLLGVDGAGEISHQPRDRQSHGRAEYGYPYLHHLLPACACPSIPPRPLPRAGRKGGRSLSRRGRFRQGGARVNPHQARGPPVSVRRTGRIRTRNRATRTSSRAAKTSQPSGSPRPIALAATPTTGMA